VKFKAFCQKGNLLNGFAMILYLLLIWFVYFVLSVDNSFSGLLAGFGQNTVSGLTITALHL